MDKLTSPRNGTFAIADRVNATPLEEVVECLMTRSFYIIFLILVKTTL